MSRVFIRAYIEEDALELLELNIRNREHFEFWMPLKPKEEQYSLGAHQERIRQTLQKMQDDRYYAFGVFLKENNALIGEVSASFIERFPAETCMIGYQLDRNYNGQGLMAEAVSQAVGLLFDKYAFHRLRAEVMPENIGSIRVLEKVGFRREGLARKSLYINGNWEDFTMFALLKEEFLE